VLKSIKKKGEIKMHEPKPGFIVFLIILFILFNKNSKKSSYTTEEMRKENIKRWRDKNSSSSNY